MMKRGTSISDTGQSRSEYLRGLRERRRAAGKCTNCATRDAREGMDTCEYCAGWQKRKREKRRAEAARKARALARGISIGGRSRANECVRCTAPVLRKPDGDVIDERLCQEHFDQLTDPEFRRVAAEVEALGGAL